MVLLPTSKLQFINKSGKIFTELSELEIGFIEIILPESEWKQVKLWRHDRELIVYSKKFKDRYKIVANWPQSDPGYYKLNLKYRGQIIEEKTIIIWPDKIDRDAFALMLADLEAKLPFSIANQLPQTGPLAGVKLIPPGENNSTQEISRLRLVINGSKQRSGLVNILDNLANRPYQILKNSQIWVRREKACNPCSSKLIKAFIKPNNLNDRAAPIQLLDRVVEPSFDNYENQFIKMFFRLVLRRIKHIYAILEADKKQPELCNEVKELLDKLKKARKRANFLDRVSQVDRIPDRVTNVFSGRSHYGTALEIYLEFIQNRSITLESSELDTPFKKIPELYQIWGTLQIINSLIKVAKQKGYHLEKEQLIIRDGGGLKVCLLPKGKTEIVLIHPKNKIKVSLFYEKTYTKNSKQLKVTSYNKRPDVAIEIESPNNNPQVYIFDPKYKLNKNYDRPKTEDIDKMHTYRDAIRDEEGKFAVKYAAILYPGSHQSYSQELEALPANPKHPEKLEKQLDRILNIALEVK